MTTSTIRMSEGHLVFSVWQVIRETPDTELADFRRISKTLTKSLSLTEFQVLELLGKLCDDGLVLRNAKPKTAIYSMPELESTIEKPHILENRDAYCYECHGPGEVLMCTKCPRVFHAGCIRPETNLDMPLRPLKEPVPQTVQNTFLQVYGISYAKAQAEKSDEISTETRLCINCRLREKNKHTLSDDSHLNLLIETAFCYIRPWIAQNTFTEQESKSIHIPSQYVKMLAPVLFQNRVTMSDISRKTLDAGYKSLVEFQCDIMDVRHCIGVLRGVNCPEYEAAQYLLLDALHAIVEISKCQDCYMHSSIKDDSQWFIKPCDPAHELVFAKQMGYSFWPAKVMRKTESHFDVRFFGPKHNRAIITARNVKPITDVPALKRSINMKKAMDELSEHRKLLQGNTDNVDKENYTLQLIKPEADSGLDVSLPSSPLALSVSFEQKDAQVMPWKKRKIQKPRNNPMEGALTVIHDSSFISKNQQKNVSLIDQLNNNTSKTQQRQLRANTKNKNNTFGPIVDQSPSDQTYTNVVKESKPKIIDHSITVNSSTLPDTNQSDLPPSINNGPRFFVKYMERSLNGCPQKYIDIAVDVFKQYLSMHESGSEKAEDPDF